jgi:hypothetical protein
MKKKRERKKNDRGEKKSYPICMPSTLISVPEYSCRAAE